MHPNNAELVAHLRTKYSDGQKIVFVSGNFNVVHPGHLRIFEFAAGCGDILFVGLHPQGFNNTIVAEHVRLHNVLKTARADEAFILPTPPDVFIQDLRPDIVVKGKEHEYSHNVEMEVIRSYGGKLLFSSDDARFASLNLLRQEHELSTQRLTRPAGYFHRQGFSTEDLLQTIQKFNGVKAVVVGDLILDEYIACNPLGMSQEDPTIVVSPIQTERFIGGAAIVAAHARALGASVSYFGLCGEDTNAVYAREKLAEYGVDAFLFADESRPTTLKQRFRAQSKTLLRVSHLRQHDMSDAMVEEFYTQLEKKLQQSNLVIFSDFNYGCLPQKLVDRIAEYCRIHGIMMVADSQASSQTSDVSRFKGMALVTPTEREARIALQDRTSGLVILAETLRKKAEAENVLVTLGAEGILIHAPHAQGSRLITDRLQAFNLAPKDPSGAGDSLLAGTSLALACGLHIWGAAYIGSLVAAYQVSRIGNQPVNIGILLDSLTTPN